MRPSRPPRNRRGFRALAILLVAGAFSALPSTAFAAGGEVRFRGLPPGADVILDGTSLGTATKTGRFNVTSLPAGTFSFQVRTKSQTVLEQVLTLGPNSVLTVAAGPVPADVPLPAAPPARAKLPRPVLSQTGRVPAPIPSIVHAQTPPAAAPVQKAPNLPREAQKVKPSTPEKIPKNLESWEGFVLSPLTGVLVLALCGCAWFFLREHQDDQGTTVPRDGQAAALPAKDPPPSPAGELPEIVTAEVEPATVPHVLQEKPETAHPVQEATSILPPDFLEELRFRETLMTRGFRRSEAPALSGPVTEITDYTVREEP